MRKIGGEKGGKFDLGGFLEKGELNEFSLRRLARILRRNEELIYVTLVSEQQLTKEYIKGEKGA